MAYVTIKNVRGNPATVIRNRHAQIVGRSKTQRTLVIRGITEQAGSCRAPLCLASSGCHAVDVGDGVRFVIARELSSFSEPAERCAALFSGNVHCWAGD